MHGFMNVKFCQNWYTVQVPYKGKQDMIFKNLFYTARSEGRAQTSTATSILKSVSDTVGRLIVVSMGLVDLNSGIAMHHRRLRARWEREINTINCTALLSKGNLIM
jgi:hypothetical protein